MGSFRAIPSRFWKRLFLFLNVATLLVALDSRQLAVPYDAFNPVTVSIGLVLSELPVYDFGFHAHPCALDLTADATSAHGSLLSFARQSLVCQNARYARALRRTVPPDRQLVRTQRRAIAHHADDDQRSLRLSYATA